MSTPDKTHVFEAFRVLLGGRLRASAAMTALARDEATSDQSRPENKYDTRALEASYLAAGQGERLGALRQLVGWLEAAVVSDHSHVGLGSLVRIQRGHIDRWALVAPQGGEVVQDELRTIELLGIRSPLGVALQGLEEGDEAEVDAPGGLRTWALLTVG